MAFYKSRDSIQNNSKKWTRNFPSLRCTTNRRDLPRIENLVTYVRLPTKIDILGRYRVLAEQHKFKTNRFEKIINELKELWRTFSFPTLSNQAITARLEKLVSDYENHQRKPNEKFENDVGNVFDITKVNGEWLCREDKDLHKRQVESCGRIGYTTYKLTSIHPSKRRRGESTPVVNATAMSSMSTAMENDDSSETASVSSQNSMDEVQLMRGTRKVPSATYHATRLVNRNSLSTNKASVVCKSLAEEGVNLPTPTQSGIWRAVIRSGEQKKQEIKEFLKVENYCLHFDGKHLSNEEYQVVCLQNERRMIKLGIAKCESGSAQDIYNGLEEILNEFDAWHSIKMIICDTTAVNTGRINGVIVKIQRKMRDRGCDIPQYIGCQHHILDRILKHVLDNFLTKVTRNPTLGYEFIETIKDQYENLQFSYEANSEMEIKENPGWRDDFKFLYELCKAFEFYMESGKFPKIKWRKLPSLHSARWNSRAIYTLMAHFLIPELRDKLNVPATFIATAWKGAWFSDQRFNNMTSSKLLEGIVKTTCPGALKCYKTHWSNDASILDVPRTNIIAERTVKLMEELHSMCKKNKYLSIKFVATKEL